MAAHLSPASWHAAIPSFPICGEALATTVCLGPSGYQLRIFLEGARQCWHLLPGSSWAAELWASLNPLSSPSPARGCLCFLAGVEPSAQKNKFSRCLTLNLEEIGAYWEGGSEGRHKVLKTRAFPGSRVGKWAGLKAGRVCKAAGLMSAQFSWDVALARYMLQGESLAGLVVTQVMAS